MRVVSALGRVLVAAVITAGVVIGGAQAASAHDSLVSSSPADGATVSPPSEVALAFSANLLGSDGGNIVIVVGPDGRHYEAGCVALAGANLTVPVELGAAGAYEVEWRAVSSDGHPVAGTFSFTTTEAGASTGAEDSPCAVAAGTTTAASDDAATAEAGGTSGLALGLVVGGGAVVVVGVLVFVILGRRTRED